MAEKESALPKGNSESVAPKKSRFRISLGKKKKKAENGETSTAVTTAAAAQSSPRTSRISSLSSSLSAIISPRQFNKLRPTVISQASSSGNNHGSTIAAAPSLSDDDIDDQSHKFDSSSSSSSNDDDEASFDGESSMHDESSRGARHTRSSGIALSSSSDDDDDEEEEDNNDRPPRQMPRRRPPNYKTIVPSRRSSDPYMGDKKGLNQYGAQSRRISTSNNFQISHSGQVLPENWNTNSHNKGGPNFVDSDNLKDSSSKPVISDITEEYRTVLVYRKPSKGESLPNLNDHDVNDNKQFQGVWASEIPQVQNPTEVWLFHNDDKPKGLEGSTARYGFWAFNPEANVENDDFSPLDLWVYPPGAMVPSRVETMGIWMYPRLLADATTIAAGKAGFINLIKTQKIGKLGVGGMWKVHYSKDQPMRIEEGSAMITSPKKEPKAIFHVKVLTGRGDETITLFPVKATDTVWDVRGKLAKANSDLPTDQSLMLDGELLEDDVRLEDYNIGHNTILEMEGMKLYIQDWDKRFFEIRVAPEDTVAMVKELASNLINVPAKMLRLSFEKALLSKENGELKKYGLHHYARLRLEPIHLCIEKANQKGQVRVPVRPVDSIHQVKQRVSQRLNNPLDTPLHRLYLQDGTELLDGFYLMDFDVEHGTVLRTAAFRITIVEDNGETYSCEVEVPEGATVGDVKFAYLGLTGVPIAHQNLYFDKTGPLDSSKKLVEYQISSGAVLSLLPSPPFVIKVVSEEGETAKLVVDQTDLLEDLMEQVANELGIPATKQVLRFRKRRLKGGLSLAEYGLKDGSTIEAFRVKILS